MPVSPGDAEDLGQPVADLHAATERSIFKRIGAALGLGLGSSSWGDDRAAGTGAFRRLITSIVGRLRGRSRQTVEQAVTEAVRRGVAQADEDLVKADIEPPDDPAPGQQTVGRATDRLMSDLTPVHTKMIDETVDRYRKIIVEVSNLVETGAATRLQAAQQALNKFADAGITGFVDKAGRNWELSTYVEMATRTATARAMIAAHLVRLEQAGIKLVIVSDAPYECPLCAPWENKVLSVGTDAVGGKHEMNVNGTRVEVAGSLDEAMAAGLFHPNCRHNISAFIPGTSKVPERKVDTGGVTYKDVQKQRYLERQARKWGRRQEVALDSPQAKEAAAKVRLYRAKIRELTQQTGLKRKTHRELPGKAR